MHTKTKKFNKYHKQQSEYGLKKHVSQMNELEKEFLMRKFRSVNKADWTFTDYSLKRFNDRKIDAQHFMSLWDADVELIEYHMKHKTNRVLLRSKAIHNGAQVCAVFSLEQMKIITVYLNYHENKHEKLKIEFYDKDLDVLQTFKGVKQYGENN